jgi:hypothetical protein
MNDARARRVSYVKKFRFHLLTSAHSKTYDASPQMAAALTVVDEGCNVPSDFPNVIDIVIGDYGNEICEAN